MLLQQTCRAGLFLQRANAPVAYEGWPGSNQDTRPPWHWSFYETTNSVYNVPSGGARADPDPLAACWLLACDCSLVLLLPSCRKARRQAAEITLCNSLQLAVVLGCLVAAVLLGCGRAFLSGMGVAPELLAPAWQYLSIRWAGGTCGAGVWRIREGVIRSFFWRAALAR